jgi:cytochrome c553
MRQTKLLRTPHLPLLLVVSASLALGVGASPDALEPELRSTLSLEADSEQGHSAYEACAVCHGADGGGLPDGTFPRLAGQHERVIIKQLVDMRTGRRENPIMHPYARRLIDPQEIANVSAYLNALPPPALIGTGPGTDLDTGERLYHRDCQACHGALAEGNGSRFVPSLAGQHFGYLLRQIRQIASGWRGNAHPGMETLVKHYVEAELKAVVDYASRLEANQRSEP